MKKITLTKYELKRKHELVMFIYGTLFFGICLIVIFSRAADFPLVWWMFILAFVISALISFISFQHLFLPYSKAAYPEIEDLKKQKVTTKYFKSQTIKIIVYLIIETIVFALITLFVLSNL